MVPLSSSLAPSRGDLGDLCRLRLERPPIWKAPEHSVHVKPRGMRAWQPSQRQVPDRGSRAFEVTSRQRGTQSTLGVAPQQSLKYHGGSHLGDYL